MTIVPREGSPALHSAALEGRATAPTASPDGVRCVLCDGAGRLLHASCRDFEYFMTSDASLYRCASCSLVFLHPLPTREALPGLYPAHYRNFKKDHGRISRFLFDRYYGRQAARCARYLKRDSAFLEVGCADGRVLSSLRRRGFENVRGIEIAAAGVEAAREKGLDVFHGALEDFETDERFDMIFMSHVIEHVLDPVATIERIAALLKPDGVVYIETPNVSSLDARLWGGHWGLIHYPRHLWLFDPTTLRALVEGAGLRVERESFELNSCGWALSIQSWLRGHGVDPSAAPRSFYYTPLLVACMPLNVLDLFAGGTAFMSMIARNPG